MELLGKLIILICNYNEPLFVEYMSNTWKYI